MSYNKMYFDMIDEVVRIACQNFWCLVQDSIINALDNELEAVPVSMTIITFMVMTLNRFLLWLTEP